MPFHSGDLRYSIRAGLLALAVAASPARAPAQSSGIGLQWGAYGALAATRLDPVPGGGNRTEVRLEQPMVTLAGQWLGGHLRFSTAVRFDKLTTSDGVLTIGAWGDGFYDREPPHDYLHEAVVSLIGGIGPDGAAGHIALSGGKGIAPFGSDPPMMRPPLHAPVNEHWTEVMDRKLGVLSLRLRRLSIEAAIFDNGTAPSTSDSAGHNHSECLICTGGQGVSRSARVTVWPLQGLEIRGSVGTLVGAGHHAGAGTGPQSQWNLSTRLDRPAGAGRLVVLLEGGVATADRSYGTLLAEGQWSTGDHRHRFYYRFERTDRPEGPRSADLFRSAPDTVGEPIGATRWLVQTAGYGFAIPARAILLEPVLELSLGRVASVGTPPINLDQLYGRRTLWSLVLAMRVLLGEPHSMGRYGAVGEELAAAHHH
jgi:hypothetical protein